jgi:hypothetical protein
MTVQAPEALRVIRMLLFADAVKVIGVFGIARTSATAGT